MLVKCWGGVTVRSLVVAAATLTALLGCSETRHPTAPDAAVGPQVLADRVVIESHCNPVPEAARKVAPPAGRAGRRDGPTILAIPCDTQDLCPTCDGLFLGWGNVHCYQTPFWDPDNDGVDNACENALAAAFAPELIFTVDCDWDYGLNRMGGEYYFAAQIKSKAVGVVVRIAFLPAYYMGLWRSGAADQPVPYLSFV